jgi:hypothetical protein
MFVTCGSVAVRRITDRETPGQRKTVCVRGATASNSPCLLMAEFLLVDDSLIQGDLQVGRMGYRLRLFFTCEACPDRLMTICATAPGPD